MAIQNLKCPNCGGELQLDDTLEKGFCMYCGSAIHIKEEVAKIKVEHSGKIEIDDTKKLANSIELADRAFDSGNYDECYNYCCSALECDINNPHIAFRKGLCAAYLSTSRISELEQAIRTAIGIINESSKYVDHKINTIFNETLDYIKSSYNLNCNYKKGFVFSDIEDVKDTFSIVADLTTLCEQCSELITEEMMRVHPTFENDKKVCLEQGLQLCKIGVSSLKYFAGYREVKKGDRYVQEEVYKSIKSPYLDMQKSYYDKFKNDFNNLPTTRKALMEYENEITELQKDIDAFNNGLEEYFKENPEIGKEYKKRARPFVLGTIALYVLIIAIAIITADYDLGTAFASLMGLLCCAFVTLLVLSIVRLIKYSKNRKRILAELPADLLNLKNIHDQSKSKLKAVNQNKAEFVKNNIKK